METYEELLLRMKQTFAQHAGYEVEKNSDLEVRLQVLAGELFSACANVEWLKRQAFPQTATDAYLTMHGEQRGLKRKEARVAIGTLTFARTEALGYNLPIPIGTVCAVDKESTVRYITTEEATLKANTLSVTVNAAAKDGGRNGNTAANTVKVMITPPSGIKTVTNSEAFIGGVDAEDDSEFRSRLMKSYENISNGTNAAFYREFAMKHPAIFSAGVIPKENGVGTVSVYVAARGGVPSGDVIAQLQQLFNEEREINVEVTVKPALIRKISFTMKIKPAVNYTFMQAKEICNKIIEDYFNQISVGGVFRIGEVGKQMLDSGAIMNYSAINFDDMQLTAKTLAVKDIITIQEGSEIV